MENLNLAPFYCGQKVVCLVTKRDEHNSLSKGEEYVVLGIKSGCEHAKWLIDIGKVHKNAFSFCSKCFLKVDGNIHWANSQYFAPIESTFASITFEEVIAIESPLIGIN